MESKKAQSNKNKMLTLYLLTRDFRTADNLTLYEAYDESVRSKTSLCVVFRFTHQVKKEENPYYCANSVQFMCEALEELTKELNISFIAPVSDDEWFQFLSDLPIHKIFLAKDFTPFARKRFENLSDVAKTIEVDDITVFPMDEYKTHNKLAYFVDAAKRMTFPDLKTKDVDWKKSTKFLDDFMSSKCKFVSNGKLNFEYPKNPNLLVRPKDLKKMWDNLAKNVKGYSVKKIRESVGTPKVSTLSAFVKFGMISIRAVHHLAKDAKDIGVEDKLAFERELYCRDFFYRFGYAKPNEVYTKPNFQGTQPRFINEEDLLKWKKESGKTPTISKEESKDIEEALKIYKNWTNGKTESPLVNAAVNELTKTGYMLNRTRMIACSYLTQDNKIWWKYAEKFFANHLTDYDWTINSISHQNIAKVGVWPKYTLNFSIKKQETTDKKDRELYYKKFNENYNK